MTTLLSARKVRAAAVAIASATLAIAGADAASATTVLGDGAALPAGTSIGGPISGAVTINVTPSPQAATCTRGEFAGTVGENSGGSVSIAMTSFRFDSCTDTIASWQLVRSTLVTNPAPVGSLTVNSGATGGTVSIPRPTLRWDWLSGGLPGVCNYTMNNASETLAGTVANGLPQGQSTLQFTAVPITTSSGICSAIVPMTMTARVAPLTVLSGPLAGQRVTLG